MSGGGTGNYWIASRLGSLNELQAGGGVLMDQTYDGPMKVPGHRQALFLVAQVISTAVPGQAVIDAGTKSLGREPIRGTDASDGFGCLLEHPEVLVSAMSEEHGILDLRSSAWRPRVGERVRVIPNHVCIVVHLNDVVHGVRGERVVESWAVEARGR